MPKTILHIDSSPRLEGSITRNLSQKIVDHLGAENVLRRDLVTPLPALDDAWINANFTPADDRTEDQKERLAQSDHLVGELKQADTIVIGAPIHNFSVTSTLKLWIDQIARAGLTFSYTENGPIGLLSGKRAIVAVASGGTQAGSDIDYATTYLRHVLGFIGITDVQIVAADQMAIDPDAALARANGEIAALAA